MSDLAAAEERYRTDHAFRELVDIIVRTAALNGYGAAELQLAVVGALLLLDHENENR